MGQFSSWTGLDKVKDQDGQKPDKTQLTLQVDPRSG
jgi:hypothetical protein